MPTYEYRCAKCGRHLEVFQSFSEEPLRVHEECGGALAKVLSPAGIVLKGSGFYKTDSRDSKRSTKRPGGAGTDTSAGSTDGASAGTNDAKQATKDSKPAPSTSEGSAA
jgi:putative FmdB family regulatory protein